MGANASQLEKEIGSKHIPEHYLGLVNFGNTCYCNSVLQALYFCRPFREKVLEYKAKNKKKNKETLLTCLADLFQSIATRKKKTGTIAPKKFITRLRKENEVFDNYLQQDAHEFLNYLLNTIADLLLAEQGPDHSSSSAPRINGSHGPTSSSCSAAEVDRESPTTSNHGNSRSGGAAASAFAAPPSASAHKTWVHEIFQGTLTNETRCLNCESLSSKDEDFLDLSVDVEQNTSITHCLDVFSNTETLSSEHKYYCENCCSKQEAQKRMIIKKSPMILALHLKRFKYMESQNRHTKLSYRVVFPLELRIMNQTGNDDRLYDLVAVVIHCGPGPNRGHYISIVKSFGLWLLFDDELVDRIDPSTIEDFFGLTSDHQKTSESGYILFYQSR
jgi:ubiquitin carboxyl-terminal hydrolase 12/46